MAVEVKHAATVVVPDDGTSPVGSDEWNAAHQLTQAGQRMLGKPSAGAGATEEMDGAAVLAFAGAEAAGTAAVAVAAHVAAADPHPAYLTTAEGNAAYAPVGHVGAGGAAHANVVAGGAAGFMTGADKTKLDGIATGATANATDATLRDRATHTGTQAASTISDFNSASRAQTEAALIAGTNITITPAGSGATRTLTIAAAGGGGATNLSYDAATRVIASDTGTDATLPLVSSGNAGLAPASGGGTTNFLRADGTWAAPPGGGGGSPGGSSGQVQYNNAGAFGGAAATEIGAEGTPQLVAGSVPSTPASGRLKLFAVARASRILPAFIGPSGLDSPLQPAIFANRVAIITPNRTTTVSNFGCGSQTAVTLSHPAPSTASMAESLYRTRFQTSTTAGNASGVRTDQQVVRGNGTTGRGGFYHAARFCTGSIALSGGQFFCGLQGSNAALAGEPSALLNLLAVGKDIADTNLQFMRNDGAGAAVKTDLGIAYAANIALNLRVFCPPSSSEIWVLVERINNDGTTTTLLDTSYTTDIPATTTFLAMHCQVRNGATAAAANVDMVQLYVESDY